MTIEPSAEPAWANRAAARSPIVKRSRERSIQQSKQIIDAALELVNETGSAFTIQELAARAQIALQTFYRHFRGKDELLLAVIEQTIGENMLAFDAGARELPDPLSRLRYLVTIPILSLGDERFDGQRRFMTAEHFRLHQLFPDELGEVNRLYTDLLIPEIEAAAALGQVTSTDVEADAWYITELVMAIYHRYSYATNVLSAEQLGDSIWTFCLRALGGGAPPPTARGRAKKKASAAADDARVPASRAKSPRR